MFWLVQLIREIVLLTVAKRKKKEVLLPQNVRFCAQTMVFPEAIHRHVLLLGYVIPVHFHL